jgi:GNAT superfamily N-acetyltransferase
MARVMTSRPVASPTAQSLDRALTFMRDVLAGTVDEIRTIPAGLIVNTPSLPAVWAANQLRVTEPISFRELVELAEENLPGPDYLDIALEDQKTGPARERTFRRGGWKVQRDLLMTLSRAPERVADTGIAVEVSEDESMELMGRWYAEDPGPTAMGHDQLVEYTRRESRVHGDQLLGVRDGDGQVVAMTKLRSHGRAAQVEDVYTVPEARGRGYARALVSRAIELARDAGAELIFITADDEDWPKLLYARIGFRPLGHLWHFHRE